uniref:Ubiquitin-like domain-containing protein n=1 Tax=Timema poppense TaxID=170557 RepID=A0A7R9HGB6_TIMPO|nr:unnamed protein product [Timema poppensis]
MDNSGNAGSSTEPPKAGGATTAEPVGNRSGCGCTSSTKITVRVTPTTGGQFDLQVAKTESVENLKKFISKKLKVPKERICLLHRDRQLRDGTLQENQLMDGSRLTLLPSVETGLLLFRARIGMYSTCDVCPFGVNTKLARVRSLKHKLQCCQDRRSFVAMPMLRGELVFFMACNPLPSYSPHPPGVEHSATPAPLILGWDFVKFSVHRL